MHLKRCYIFRVYSRGREVHGWIVPYHIQVRVYLSSPRLPYIFLVCVSSVRGKKKLDTKKREGPRSKVYYVCVCVCACVCVCTCLQRWTDIRKITMKPWTHTNHGRPRMSEILQSVVNHIHVGMHVKKVPNFDLCRGSLRGIVHNYS